MFEWIFRSKVFETTQLELKTQVENLLRARNLDFIIRQDNLNYRNSFDAARIGNIVPPKYSYAFYVNRKQADEASILIKMMFR